MPDRDTRPTKLTPRQLHETHRWIPLDELNLLPNNPNKGNDPALQASLDEFGWVDGIVAHQGTVIAGNHRVEAARNDNEEGLPGYDLSAYDIDTARRMAIAIVHNRTTRLGTDDQTMLAEAVGGLSEPDLAALSYTPEELADLDAILTFDAIPPPAPVLQAADDDADATDDVKDKYLVSPVRQFVLSYVLDEYTVVAADIRKLASDPTEPNAAIVARVIHDAAQRL